MIQKVIPKSVSSKYAAHHGYARHSPTTPPLGLLNPAWSGTVPDLRSDEDCISEVTKTSLCGVSKTYVSNLLQDPISTFVICRDNIASLRTCLFAQRSNQLHTICSCRGNRRIESHLVWATNQGFDDWAGISRYVKFDGYCLRLWERGFSRFTM